MADEQGVEIGPPPAVIDTQSSGLLTIVQIPAKLVMFNLSEEQVDSLADLSPQTDLGFLGIAVGMFVAFLSIIVTVDLPDRMNAVFVGLTVLTALLSLYFLAQAIRHFGTASTRLRRIKQSQQRH